MMKKFIINIIGFIVIFVLINFIYLLFLIKTDWNFKKRIESLNFYSPKHELLVLGNSLASDGIDTKMLTEYGVNSYNLAIGGSSIKTNFIQLQEYLNLYGHTPDYVILAQGSYMGNFHGEEVHPIVDFTMNDNKKTFKDIPLIKFQWLATEFAKKIVSSKHRNAKLSFGQVKYTKKVVDNTEISNRDFYLTYYSESKYVEKIANLCCTNGIQFVIVEMPGFRTTRNVQEIGPFTISFNGDCLASLYNFNFNEFCQIFDSHQDWIGNSHLNQYGAEKFTGVLINKIFIEHIDINQIEDQEIQHLDD